MKKFLRLFSSIYTKPLLAGLLTILLCTDSYAQRADGIIRGIVTDENNIPLPNVTVTIKGSTGGTTTNENGSYAIPVKGPGDVLLFSLTGTVPKEVKAGDKKVVN